MKQLLPHLPRFRSRHLPPCEKEGARSVSLLQPPPVPPHLPPSERGVARSVSLQLPPSERGGARSAGGSTPCAASAAPAAARGSRRAAFTLIELIAVMGIIVALALVVVGGYSGMTRAIATGQATRQVRDALLLARQTACVRGVRVYCYFLSEEEYVLCRKIGTSSGQDRSSSDDRFPKGDSGHVFPDSYTDLSSFINEVDAASEAYSDDNDSGYDKSALTSDLLLFQLSDSGEARYGKLRWVEADKDKGYGWNLFYAPVDGHEPNFKTNTDYGIALFPIRVLPKGFAFDEDMIGQFVYFEPTGTANKKTTITISESAIHDSDRQQKVVVESNGKVE